MYDGQGNQVTRWNFANAYPVKWVGPQFAADGKTAAVETLELAHDGLIPD
jgi:phage tail-like protein